MPLDSETVTILSGAAVAVIAALGAAAVQIILAFRTQRKVDANTDITKQAGKVTSEAAADTAVILGHVNSEATQLKAEIASQMKQIEDMRLQLEAAERRAIMLAQASVVAAAACPPSKTV